MNYQSRFRMTVLAVALTFAATKSDGKIVRVSREVYHSRTCWFDGRGDFSAFLVFARDGRVAVPYFISTRCVVSAGYSSDAVATIYHLNTIRMTDSYGILQRALPEVIISDNLRTDQSQPSSDSIVYYFRARFIKVGGRYRIIYAPQNIIELTQINIPFERFLRLPMTGRERLASECKLRDYGDSAPN